MRAFVLVGLFALLVGLVACSNDPGPPGPNDATQYLPRDIFYVSGQRCDPSVWITGVIVKGPLARDPGWASAPPAVGTGIQDDKDGVIYGIIWGLSNTGRIEYGKRYKLGGSWFLTPRVTFWACGGAEAVIPQ